MMNCETFSMKRACFFGKISSILPDFPAMSNADKLKTILCPKSTAAVKIVNKFIRIMFLARDEISEGLNLITYPTMPANIYPFSDYFDNFSDCDEWEENFEEPVLSDYEND